MSSLLPYVAGAGSATVVATALGGILSRVGRTLVERVVLSELSKLQQVLERRFDKNDEQTAATNKKAQELEVKLATEFGGNSGGMRQAINALQTDVSTMKTDIAVLKSAQPPVPAPTPPLWAQ